MTTPGDRAASSEEGAGGTVRERVTSYLRSHHTATVATVAPPGAADAGAPHAASVFYAADDHLRMVFLSKGSSRHGAHIIAAARVADTDRERGARGAGGAAPVAVTVAGTYDDWREIQGLQIWGTAERLRGLARAAGMAVYLKRFPFVAGLLKDPRLARQLAEIEVFRVTPERVALTDNRVGLFGRETLELGASSTDVATGGRIRGFVVAGRREAAGFIDIPWVRERIGAILGVAPYPGTLNLLVRDPDALAAWRRLVEAGACLELSSGGDGVCAAQYYPVLVDGTVPAGIVLPHVEGYPGDVVEVVAGERLRDTLGLVDGDEVVLEWE